MKKMWQKIRLQWFISHRTLGYTYDYIERLYKIYLNHNKIIHFRDGYPVYSLSTPALFSKPGANFFARAAFRTIQNRNLPNLMSFAVNDICNAACKHCSFFTAIDDKTKQVLPLSEAQSLIRQAQELGVSTINFVGGEPLMRSDLDEIIRSVDKDISTTVLFTNGWFLEEQVSKLKSAGLDSVYISLDAADPRAHDEFRRKKGLFDRAVAGIKRAISLGLSTGISFTVRPENMAEGEFEKIVELAKSIGVHEVVVFDALPVGRYKNREDLKQDHSWTDELISRSRPYNDDLSYPGILVHAYTTSHASVGCACGTSYFYASPYGDISSCDFNSRSFGTVRQEPLYLIWDRLTSHHAYRRSKWGGCKVKDINYIKKLNRNSADGTDCDNCECSDH